jgi:hypothetical protein
MLRERLQPDALSGIATSAALARALRSAGQAMDPAKEILIVFLTSHGSPDTRVPGHGAKRFHLARFDPCCTRIANGAT